MKTHLTIVAILVSLSAPGATIVRESTDSTGKYSVEAELVDVRGETVRLTKQDGKMVVVPICRLSAEDQRWVKQPASRGREGTKSARGSPNLATRPLQTPEDISRGGAPKAAIKVKSPSAGAADKPSISQWPRLTGDMAGPNPLRIRNPNGYTVKIALRCGTRGLDFSVAALDSTTVHVRDSRYDIYFQYSDDPAALYQGDSLTLSGHGAEIQPLQVVDGNFGICRVK